MIAAKATMERDVACSRGPETAEAEIAERA
jgi:hypothetical protein